MHRCLLCTALVLGWSTGITACSSGATGTDPTADPWAVLATAGAARASASASAQASLEAAASAAGLTPDLFQRREEALGTEEPEQPAEMGADGEGGAIAAATYFLELYPYAYATGDLTRFDELSDEACEFCTTVHSNVTALHDGGGWMDYWEPTITDAVVTQSSTVGIGSFYVVSLQMTTPDATGFDGTTEQAFTAQNGPMAVVVMWDGAQWAALEVTKSE